MPSIRTCPACNHDYPSSQHYCPHCARPALYPNVEHAAEPAEQAAVQSCYDQALLDADTRGVVGLVQDFEHAVQGSKAVIARSYREAERLCASPNELYATYYNLVDAGVRMNGPDKYDRLRVAADPIMFYGYHEDIRFGCLTLNDLGLPGYGECFLVLGEDMIAHRSSVFEENSLDWILKHDLKFSDVFTNEYNLPVGSRAVWDKRAELSVAKLAEQISSLTAPTDFPKLLLSPKKSDADLDQFIEVHIWGPLTVYCIEQVVMPPLAGETKKEKAFRIGIADRLQKAKVVVKLI